MRRSGKSSAEGHGLSLTAHVIYLVSALMLLAAIAASWNLGQPGWLTGGKIFASLVLVGIAASHLLAVLEHVRRRREE